MQNIITPKSIISKNCERRTGRDVWRENLRLMVFAADKIQSSLGPSGAYKLVTYNRGPEQVVKVTKDTIAVLDELAIQYPPAVVVSEAAKMQRDEAGDGVATFVVLLSALLKKADMLMEMKIHPNTILHGYYLAQAKALEIIDKHATTLNSPDSDILDVVDCGRNLLTPRIRAMVRDAYQSAISNGKFDKDKVRFLSKPGGSGDESSLIRGVVVKKEKAHPNMPDRVGKLLIVVSTEKPGINRLELKMKGEGPTPIRLNVKDADQLSRYKETETKLKLQALDKLTDLKANVFICTQPLEESVKQKLLVSGVFAMEKVDAKDAEAVAAATGARIVGQLGDLAGEDLGFADELFTDQIELEKTATILGCKGATFVLRGNTPQSIDDLEAAIRNSLTVLKVMDGDGRVLPGGGAVEAEIRDELGQYAKSFFREGTDGD